MAAAATAVSWLPAGRLGTTDRRSGQGQGPSERQENIDLIRGTFPGANAWAGKEIAQKAPAPVSMGAAAALTLPAGQPSRSNQIQRAGAAR